jgi:hypothetical protein
VNQPLEICFSRRHPTPPFLKHTYNLYAKNLIPLKSERYFDFNTKIAICIVNELTDLYLFTEHVLGNI